MYIITVNDTDYECIETWKEMKLSKAIEIQQILDDLPSLLKEIYDLNISTSDTKEADLNKLLDKVEIEDRMKHFPVFYGEVVKAFTDITGEVMNGIMWDVRTSFYKEHCLNLVMGLLYGDQSNIKNIESFKLSGETFYLPTSDNVLGNPVPMANAQTIEFTEVADLEIYSEKLNGGKYQIAANIISILCRPKGEEYDEQTSLKRADMFMDLTMDIVWEVFFCIHQLSIISSQNILIYQSEKALEATNLKRPALIRLGGMGGYWRSLKRKYLSETLKGRLQ